MEPNLAELAISSDLHAVIRELGFEQLTAIQAESIPLLLAGRDLVGQSKTGSGKTVAYALPILQRIDLQRRQLSVLVLCPTRELSAQVARELRRLGRRHAGLQVLVLAGGEPLRPQANALERGVHIAVGTPGRVLDHLRRGILRLDEIGTLVLDEADRMLDMGFQEDVEEILAAVPSTRQTVFFSATFPDSIAALSEKYQRDAARIVIQEEARESAQIRQLLIEVEADRKLYALRLVLKQHAHEAALIFANLKATVAQLEKALSAVGVSAGSLHGDLEQYDRDRVLAMFRNGSTRVLIATDVAARGIDVENLDLVINYDLPSQPEVYVHRIGRTGRAGKAGLAISFATSREKAKIKAIEQSAGVSLEQSRLDTEQGVGEGASAEGQSLEREAKMDTLQISGGRKQKVRPGDILGALTGEAGGLRAEDVGKIEIHDNFAYVAIARGVSQEAHKCLNNGRIKGRKFHVAFVK